MMIDDIAGPRHRKIRSSQLVFITVSPKSISRGRSYQSELRRQQAQATRTRIVSTAARLFAAQGFARTTLAKIAAEAGVSAETVQLQGPKAALLIAAIEYAAFGVAGEDDVLNLDVGRTIVATDDFDEALDLFLAAQMDVHERAADLATALIGGANADPELDRYRGDLIASVNRQIGRVLEHFRDRGWLRTDVGFEELVETAAVLGSVETFRRVTHHDGWSVDAYRAWWRRMLIETVFRRPT
ncbi:TetR/AcrR family transcriptional regulator [Mycolicibacterium sp. GF69]|uniref:TetR/AcrR family transcriptional regulator n=1 Tax=Mycolicibacterium sp. GF69 TaxID=2267251 RepID=UPI00197B4EDC|nr:TetR/AcrR family transcriptional regulator [Mycolicibacterium sp. GF69]